MKSLTTLIILTTLFISCGQSTDADDKIEVMEKLVQCMQDNEALKVEAEKQAELALNAAAMARMQEKRADKATYEAEEHHKISVEQTARARKAESALRALEGK